MLNNFRTYFRYTLILTTLVFLWGCNLTLTHDLTFHDDNSGEVVITAEVEYDALAEDGETPSGDNPLHEYVEFASELWGITVTDESMQDLSDEDYVHYVYSVTANFDDVSELGIWLAVQDANALEQQIDEDQTNLIIYPQLLQLTSESLLNDHTGDYSLVDIEASFNVTVPRVIQDSDLNAQITHDGHTARWTTTIDEDFFNAGDLIYSVSY